MNNSDFKEKVLQTKDRVIFKAKEVGRKVAQTTANTVKWAVENPEKIAAIAGGAAVMDRLIRRFHRNVTVRHEIYDRRHRVYDHSMNAYIHLKRPLRAGDIEKINEARRRTGKRVSEILMDMDLVKR